MTFLYILLTLYLRYDKPASCAEEALPLGNGMQGMLVYGGTAEDRISLNDITLWTGEPDTTVWTPGASAYADSVREALREEDYPRANALARKVEGHNSERYQPLGTLYIEDLNAGEAGEAGETGKPGKTGESGENGGNGIYGYERRLSLDSATATVHYSTPRGGETTRRYYCSYPDSVSVIELRSSKEMHYRIRIETPHPKKRSGENGENGGSFATFATFATSKIDAYLPYCTHIRPDQGELTLYDENRGIHFRTAVKVVAPKGKVRMANESTIEVSGCREATILVVTQSSYNGPYRDPVREGRDYQAAATRILAKADKKIAKNYRRGQKELYSRHLADYREYYERVELDLGETPDSIAKLPTDEQLRRYKNRSEFNPDLEETYFQYGRYLLIACSRTRGVPANLQGLWNESLTPPWSCNYTTNINVEENYWPAEVAGLSEMHETALCEWILQLPKSGRVTAREYWGGEGWCCGHNSDIWCMTNPVGYQREDPRWACWNMGGAWLCTHLWEHYRGINGANRSNKSNGTDRSNKTNKPNKTKVPKCQSATTFLERAYPVMREAADFCMSMLVERDGYLMTALSTSPENTYLTDEGYEGSVLYGGTADIAIIRELLTDTKLATLSLYYNGKRSDACLRTLYPPRRKPLLPLQREDAPGTDPIDAIASYSGIEAYIAKLDSVLERLLPYRIGADGTIQEWYHDWKDPEPWHRHQSHLIGLYPGHQITVEETPELAEACRKTLERKGEWTTGWSAGWRVCLWARLQDGEHAYSMLRQMMAESTYPNLWDAHPPFQIDGNFGATAGIIEMFKQNAIPEVWKNAKFSQK